MADGSLFVGFTPNSASLVTLVESSDNSSSLPPAGPFAASPLSGSSSIESAALTVPVKSSDNVRLTNTLSPGSISLSPGCAILVVSLKPADHSGSSVSLRSHASGPGSVASLVGSAVLAVSHPSSDDGGGVASSTVLALGDGSLDLIVSQVTSVSADGSLLVAIFPHSANLVSFEEVSHNSGISPVSDPVAVSESSISLLVGGAASIVLGPSSNHSSALLVLCVLAISTVLIGSLKLGRGEASSVSTFGSSVIALSPHCADVITSKEMLLNAGTFPWSEPLALGVGSVSLSIGCASSEVFGPGLKFLAMNRVVSLDSGQASGWLFLVSSWSLNGCVVEDCGDAFSFG